MAWNLDEQTCFGLGLSRRHFRMNSVWVGEERINLTDEATKIRYEGAIATYLPYYFLGNMELSERGYALVLSIETFGLLGGVENASALFQTPWDVRIDFVGEADPLVYIRSLETEDYIFLYGLISRVDGRVLPSELARERLRKALDHLTTRSVI